MKIKLPYFIVVTQVCFGTVYKVKSETGTGEIKKNELRIVCRMEGVI